MAWLDAVNTCLLLSSICYCLVTCHDGLQYLPETRHEPFSKADTQPIHGINVSGGNHSRTKRRNNMAEYVASKRYGNTSKRQNHLADGIRSKRQNHVVDDIRFKRQLPTTRENETFVGVNHRDDKTAFHKEKSVVLADKMEKSQPTFDSTRQNDTTNKVQSDLFLVSKQTMVSRRLEDKTHLKHDDTNKEELHGDSQITQEVEHGTRQDDLEAKDTGPQNRHPHQPLSSKPPLKLVLSVIGAVLASVLLTGVIRWRVKKRLETKRIAEIKLTQHSLEVMNPAMRNQREWAMDTIIECDEGAESSPRQNRFNRIRKPHRVNSVGQIANSSSRAGCSGLNNTSEANVPSNGRGTRTVQEYLGHTGQTAAGQDMRSNANNENDVTTQEPLLGDSEESMTLMDEREQQRSQPIPSLLQECGNNSLGGSRGILGSLLDTWRSLPFNRDWVGKRWLELHNFRRISDILRRRHHASNGDVREDEEEDLPEIPITETDNMFDTGNEVGDSLLSAAADQEMSRQRISPDLNGENENLQINPGLARTGGDVTYQEDNLAQEHTVVDNNVNASLPSTLRDCENLNMNQRTDEPESERVNIYIPESERSVVTIPFSAEQTDQQNPQCSGLDTHTPVFSTDTSDVHTTTSQLNLRHDNQQPPPEYREFLNNQTPPMPLTSVGQFGNNRHRRSKSRDRQRINRHYYSRSRGPESFDPISPRISLDEASRHMTRASSPVTIYDETVTSAAHHNTCPMATGSTVSQENQIPPFPQNNSNSSVTGSPTTNSLNDSGIPSVGHGYPHHEGVVIEQLADGSQIIFLPPPSLPAYYQDTPPPYQE